jgi:NADH oxidase (H2O-forming)
VRNLQLRKNVYWIGAQDPNLEVFDIIMETKYGTSYNSYLVKGENSVALVETVKEKFFDQYISTIEELVPLKSIKYLIVNHTEPDHSGSIARILDSIPGITIVGSSTAIGFLKEITNRSFPFIEVTTGDRLSLGDKEFEFINAPFLHWPDSIYSYLKEDKILFTCDSFGAHYSFQPLLLSKLEDKTDYYDALSYYFSTIFSPFKEYMRAAIRKIRHLSIDIIATGHGPVIDENPRSIIDIYQKNSIEVENYSEKTVVIPYVSAYGYTKTLAETISDILKKEGVNSLLFNMEKETASTVFEALEKSHGVLFGTPTINGDALKPIWDLVTSLSPIVHAGLIASSFGSYGWSGEGVPNIIGRLDQLRLKVMDGYSVKFKPSKDQLEEVESFGKRVAKAVLTGDVPLRLKGTSIPQNLNPGGTIKKWKCIICGEIFEGVMPPEVCPACGVGQDMFVAVEEEFVQFTSNSPEKIVIIGNSAASVAAMEAIRDRNIVCSIDVFNSDSYPAYYRPYISKMMNDPLSDDKFFIKPSGWYKENGITIHNNQTILSINRQLKRIFTADNDWYSYDKLILTNGAECFIPPIENISLKGVFVMRSYTDSLNILKYAKQSKSVVVLGGGVLGLELAWEFKQMGLDVTVIEMASRALPNQLDIDGSSIFCKYIEESGINFVKSDSVSRINGREFVNGIETSNGKYIQCDMVIVSVGIRSNIKIARDAGIKTMRGVIVDDRMCTSDPSIFAAGDVAQYGNGLPAIWSVALEMGKVSGANITGDSLKFETSLQPFTFSGMGTEIFAIGDTGKSDEDKYETIVVSAPSLGEYRRFFMKDGIFVGAMIVGDTSIAPKLLEALNNNVSTRELSKIILT